MTIGIIGGAGYTAGELLRLLINHPEVEIKFVHSTSHAGSKIYEVHPGLFGETELTFTDTFDLFSIDLLFMCSGHGKSKQFFEENHIPKSLKVIDLAQDFRDESHEFVYGLPEMNKVKIEKAYRIANPGCFATAIQLAVLPLAAAGLLKSDIEVTAVTGSTGAGIRPADTTHFSWRSDNISAYKSFTHQHLIEINRNLKSLQKDFSHDINFVPMRGDFTRGIFTNIYTDCDLNIKEILSLYKTYYQDSAFTFIFNKSVDLKQVVNTNKCLLSLEKHGKKLLINSVIDNLLKGASGQAVQNMNLMFGFDEKLGLKLKASAF